jgi:hypothetical protein
MKEWMWAVSIWMNISQVILRNRVNWAHIVCFSTLSDKAEWWTHYLKCNLSTMDACLFFDFRCFKVRLFGPYASSSHL